MKAPPLPGRLVSLGTHRLHVHCSGSGTPAVVFDAALGGSSLSWTYVQPAVAAFTAACVYDRAGFGWSDGGPMPRTAQRLAAELHTLLADGGIAPPYVLVGHSFGGLVIRAYTSGHPENVAGLVFVDPAHPEEWCAPSADARERLERGVTLCRRGVLAARFGVAGLVARLASAGALDLARGIAAAVSRRTLQRTDEEILAPVTKLPMEVRAVLRWMWTQPRYFEALGSQIERVCESAAAIDRSPDYGNLPLVTISAATASAERLRLQGALARRSTAGRHVVASHSGHWIPLDEPEAIAGAISEIVAMVRSRERDFFLQRPRTFVVQLRKIEAISGTSELAAVLRLALAMSAEIAIGRGLAALAHPQLAWRVLSIRGRMCLTGAYLVASYFAVLAALLLALH